MKTSMRAALLGIAIVSSGGCHFAGSLAKEVVVAASSHRGWDTFTFKGQLPAEFGIDVYALYGPENPDSPSCQSPTFTPGETVTRSHSQHYTEDISDKPQSFDFDIPLTYTKGLCPMKLGRLSLEINARHGPLKWQKAYGRGNFYISNKPSSDYTAFPASGILNVDTQCGFLFQESRIYIGIDKRLICNSTGAYLNREELKNKTLNLLVDSDVEEEPAHNETWIKFPQGWKPCAHKGQWRWCKAPIEFKTFQMDGKTCTIYPGCTESER